LALWGSAGAATLAVSRTIARFAVAFAALLVRRPAVEDFELAEGFGLPARAVFVRGFAAGLPRVLPRRAGCCFLAMMVHSCEVHVDSLST
jgi:hypothetical protein